MTCIIGLEHGGIVYMGGDSSASDGYHLYRTPYPKVFRRGSLLVGWSTSYRMGQLLEHTWTPPVSDRQDMAFMVNDIVPSLQQCFAEAQFDYQDGEGCIVIGFRGGLYCLYGTWQVQRYADGLFTIGTGYMLARGAMLALAEMEPKARILRALEIAGQVSDSVCGPYYVLEGAPSNEQSTENGRRTAPAGE